MSTKPSVKRQAPMERRREQPSPNTVRHLLKKVERELARAQRRRDELVAQLQEAGDDHRAHAEIGTQLTAAQAELDATEERWLELSVEAG